MAGDVPRPGERVMETNGGYICGFCNDTMMSCVKHKLNPHALTAELRCHGAQVQVPYRQVQRV